MLTNKLQEIMDEYGFFPATLDDVRKQRVLFQWMQEATNRIQDLRTYEIESLTERVNDLEHMLAAHEQVIKELAKLVQEFALVMKEHVRAQS